MAGVGVWVLFKGVEFACEMKGSNWRLADWTMLRLSPFLAGFRAFRSCDVLQNSNTCDSQQRAAQTRNQVERNTVCRLLYIST